MRGPEQARINSLLAAMPLAVRERISPHLETVWLTLGDNVPEPTSQSGYLYFPLTAIVSIVYVLHDGASGEVAQVGHEGMIGLSLFMGGQSRLTRAIVQTSGFALRLKAQHLAGDLAQTGPLFTLMLRYHQALNLQTTQIAACNRRHHIEQQLCRWLLSSLDRLPGSDLEITHEFLSTILGVRREAITVAARKLQAEGLIHCRRAHITVMNRTGLEAKSCECYRLVRNEMNRLLPAPAPETLAAHRTHGFGPREFELPAAGSRLGSMSSRPLPTRSGYSIA